MYIYIYYILKSGHTIWKHLYLAVQNNIATPLQSSLNQFQSSYWIIVVPRVSVNGHKSNDKMCKMLLTWKYLTYDNILVNILVIIL